MTIKQDSIEIKKNLAKIRKNMCSTTGIFWGAYICGLSTGITVAVVLYLLFVYGG